VQGKWMEMCKEWGGVTVLEVSKFLESSFGLVQKNLMDIWNTQHNATKSHFVLLGFA
jgi:hypothetical protein